MRIFLISILLLVTKVQADKPCNLLFIHMEDMGVQIPAYGDHTVATPNLDQLAAEGIVFERAHVTAATCAASRGTLFSGLYPHQNGIMGFVKQHGFHYRNGIPTFVRDLKDAGYATGITYKDGIESAHYGRSFRPVPFDFHPKYTDNYLTGQVGDKAPKGEDDPPLVSFSVDNFRYFLEQLSDDTPFYFQAQTPDTHHTWNRPHFIRDGEPDWPYPKVDRKRMTKTPGWGDALPPEDGLLKSVAEYYTAIQRVDWYVGRILSLLDEFGHADNTLVIFSADHGPSHLLRGKTTPLESGLRVPLIVRWPGRITEPGTRTDALVSFVDLYPTFVDAAGLSIPSHLPGHSLVPVLKGEPASRKHLYSAYVAHTTGLHLYWPTRTVTDGRWKLIHHVLGDGQRKRYESRNHALISLNKQIDLMPDGSLAKRLRRRSEIPPAFELYDLQSDPDEQRNLFGQGEVSATQQRLMKRLDDWRRESSDPFIDPQFIDRFSETYRTNYQIWESLGGHKMKDNKALDFSEYIPDWDPAAYVGKQDR